MAKLPHYALNYDALEATIEEFFHDKDYEWELEKESAVVHNILIVNKEKSKKPGIVKIYNRQGQYCMDVVGAIILRKIGEECRQFLINRLRIPYMDAKCFVLHDVDADLFAFFIEELKSDYDLSDEKGDVAEAIHYVLTDVYRSSVSLTFYNTGTLRIQGVYTALFTNIIAEASRELRGVNDAFVKELMSLSQMRTERYPTDINQLVSNNTPLIDNHLDGFVTTSTILADSGIELGDYACYTFGILKAIEGLLAVKLNNYFRSDQDNIGGVCFDKEDGTGQYHLKSMVTDFDGNVELKKYIEKAYNFYNKNRHTTFHTKKLHVETSRILTYEDSIGIIDDSLEIIRGLCSNW